MFKGKNSSIIKKRLMCWILNVKVQMKDEIGLNKSVHTDSLLNDNISFNF